MLQIMFVLFAYLRQVLLALNFAARNWKFTLERKYVLLFCALGILAVIFLVACTTPTPPASLEPTPTAAAQVTPASTLTAVTAEPIEVLFVGNSLTFFNDLPDMFAELTRSAGQEIEVDMVAEGGWALADHAQSSATLEKIQRGSWDYVVLQEKSRLPAIPGLRNEYMVPAVRLLDEQISESGAETILFMTWGNRDGLPEAGYEDYVKMQSQIQAGYLEIGGELGAIVAPVGVAWQSAIEREPKSNLWQMDGIHPSREGTFLAANVFYALIFQQSPEGLIYNGDLTEETTQVLQAVAADTVLENLEQWHIP